MTPEGFMNFVAWRKNVEKYFDNNEVSSWQTLSSVV
jgi:hypothetical protein